MRLLAKVSIPAAIILAVMTANIFLWQLPVIGATFLLGYGLLLGYAMGRKFFPAEGAGEQTFLGLPLMLGLWAILGSAFFYLGKLDNAAAVTMLVAPLLLFAGKIREPKVAGLEPARLSFTAIMCGTGFVLLEFAALFLLARSETIAALRSPWERVPDEFFFIFFLASLGLLLLLESRKRSMSKIVLMSAHAAIFFSVGLLVFDAGFGFDPFIHRATEQYILNHGTIFPKPPYYAGEYALVVFLSRATFLPIEWLNKLLVPIMAAASLPPLALWAFGSRLKEDSLLYKLAPLAPLVFFIFPHSSFTSTTPQGLANLFLLFSILTIFSETGLAKGAAAAAIFSLAALAIHPLAGIPAVFFLIFCLLRRVRKKNLRFVLYTLLAAGSSLAIPLTFIWLGRAGGSGGFFNLGQINAAGLIPRAEIPFRFNFLLDIVYLYGWNHGFFLLLAALTGFFLIKKRLPDASSTPFILASFAAFVNSLILAAFVSFPALIDYEQGVYSARLKEISGFFLLPLSILGAAWFYERLKAGRAMRLFSLILLPATMTASLYLSYPRTDKYESTHGFSTSLSDIHAVQEIEKDATGKKYIVLANQAVGAAALQEFGFTNFYKILNPQTANLKPQEIYFYSVPTGGLLYPFYLKMVYENGGRKTMNEAMDLAGVTLGYIAISHYWTDARRLTEDLASIADKEIVVDGGRVYVYKFKR